MSKPSLINRQFICYLTGLLILAVGSNLFLKADLGVAPSCTIALALTRLFSFGNYASFNFLTNFALLICETFIEKKAGKKQLIQLGLIFIYSLFIQLTSLPVQLITADFLSSRVILSFIACTVMAAGSSCTICSGYAVLPMEGFVSALSGKMNRSFGTVRICVEVIMTVFSAALSFIFLHNLSVIGIGTVLAAFLTGAVTNWFILHVIRKYNLC